MTSLILNSRNKVQDHPSTELRPGDGVLIQQGSSLLSVTSHGPDARGIFVSAIPTEDHVSAAIALEATAYGSSIPESAIGVCGSGTGYGGVGVTGDGAFYGVKGCQAPHDDGTTTSGGCGVRGIGGIGVWGSGDSGVLGEGTSGAGVQGIYTGDPGLEPPGCGVAGRGVVGVCGVGADAVDGVGVEGTARTGLKGTGTVTGTLGACPEGPGLSLGTGVRGEGPTGVLGVSRSHAGVVGRCHDPEGVGVVGVSSTGLAGLFLGDVTISGHCIVTGALPHRGVAGSKEEGSLIHHIAMCSNEVMDVYCGTATTGEDGLATVGLPDYAQALGERFHYQLTVIGEPVSVSVFRECDRGQFQIKAALPRVTVSWQVTAVRSGTSIPRGRALSTAKYAWIEDPPPATEAERMTIPH